jgi:hypothetical protein
MPVGSQSVVIPALQQFAEIRPYLGSMDWAVKERTLPTTLLGGIVFISNQFSIRQEEL